MTRQFPPAIYRYAAAIIANVAVVGINFLLGLREHFSSALFLAAVAVTAWYGGLGPPHSIISLSASCTRSI
jgi:hypothetical protein